MNRRTVLKALTCVPLAAVIPMPEWTGVTSSSSVETVATMAPLIAGDVFTVAGCYARNPITGKATEFLQQFVATSDVTWAGNVPCAPYRSVHTSEVRPLGTLVAAPAHSQDEAEPMP